MKELQALKFVALFICIQFAYRINLIEFPKDIKSKFQTCSNGFGMISS
jgi:hypothetical protein